MRVIVYDCGCLTKTTKVVRFSDHLAAIAEKDAEIAYYKERACCDPDNKWGHISDCPRYRVDDLKKEIGG